MDGASLGKAMSGLAVLAVVGMVCTGIVAAFAPAAIFMGAIWLIYRLFTGASLDLYWSTYGWLTAVWLGIVALAVFADWLVQTVKRRRDQRRHEDFMRIRKMFYADNAVCLDNYEMLKRREREMIAARDLKTAGASA